MENFNTIRETLGSLSQYNKIYLLGSTGSGKTSLVRQIIGGTHYSFPPTSYRRTTVAPTEYIIDKSLAFKAKIIVKNKEEIFDSIKELITLAIEKSVTEAIEEKDIKYELEQSSDERLKLKTIISEGFFTEKSSYILNNITPKFKGKDLEDAFSDEVIDSEIDKLTSSFISEIEKNFNNFHSEKYDLFSNDQIEISNYTEKGLFIEQLKSVLGSEWGSITTLIEYAQIQGDLAADWVNEESKFVIIDGEGIGHSMKEKRDVLSTRHFDFFNFCDSIVLLENSENPFTNGGQGAIESIFLNGYRHKFILAFSKVDKLTNSDTNSRFRQDIRNLSNALKSENIDFPIQNKDSFKLYNLDKNKINDDGKKSISKILKRIDKTTNSNFKIIEFDFNNLFLNLDREKYINKFESTLLKRHWATIKAFSKRMLNTEKDYKTIKPVSLILDFFMREINLFLGSDDQYDSDIAYTKDTIRQRCSTSILEYIYQNFIVENNHLWEQAYLKRGYGSDRERKEFIFSQIIEKFIPNREDNVFEDFKSIFKTILIESGAKEAKSAIGIRLKSVEIKKIYNQINFSWTLGGNTNILIGKNGSGKSTILRLINACINDDTAIFEKYNFPIVKLGLSKYYENDEEQQIEINNKSKYRIKSKLISTFDNEPDLNSLNIELDTLVKDFNNYRVFLSQTFTNQTVDKSNTAKDILDNITTGNLEQLDEYKKCLTEIEEIKSVIYSDITKFIEILNSYFKESGKKLSTDDVDNPLIVKQKKGTNEIDLSIPNLSSGEKQLLVIFLNVILTKGQPTIFLMDEPEISLHVEWQTSFIDNIHKINPNIQLIIATHNPLITFNRDGNEIGKIISNKDTVKVFENGTKFLDISSILLEFFELKSLVGKDMQEHIKKFTELKIKKELNKEEQEEINKLENIIENSNVGDVLYNKQYFKFIKFLKDNKNITEDIEDVDEEDFKNFLEEFGGQNND